MGPSRIQFLTCSLGLLFWGPHKIDLFDEIQRFVNWSAWEETCMLSYLIRYASYGLSILFGIERYWTVGLTIIRFRLTQFGTYSEIALGPVLFVL